MNGAQTVIETNLIGNIKLSADTFLMKLGSSGFSAQAGQCVKIRAWKDGPFLDRPFSIHDLDDRGRLSILYRVVGPATALMSGLTAGARVKVTGPFGRGLEEAAGDLKKIYLAAGGIGLAPMHFTCRRLGGRARLFYGERRREFQVPPSWLAAWSPDFEASCEDGLGYGRRGLISEALEEALIREPRPVFACGPHPMLKAVSDLALKYGVTPWVSVEARMACCFGICLTCSLPLKNGGRFRACQEGPVCDGSLIDWSLVR